jgi:TRAP-type mannitol/chloroaromatic compound transport system permease large subunit
MQMAFLSPPFGYSLFYLKSVAPPEVTMATIFRGALNFIGLQWLGLALQLHFIVNSDSMSHHDSEDRGWQEHRLRQLWSFGRSRFAM